jgi:hypothetical protein
MGTRDWYYVGKFGQVGPLPEEHALDLASCGVISSETFVWSEGMEDWKRASDVEAFKAKVPSPPPPPAPFPRPVSGTPYSMQPRDFAYLIPDKPRSPLSRTAAGVLNLFVPGVGRMYLGYIGIGTLQLVVAFATCFVGHIWSFIDGILMLSGAVNEDGIGRTLDP